MRLVLFVFIIPFLANAFKLETLWTEEFTKEVHLSCSDSLVCQDFCQSDDCIFPEDYCRNCVGQNIRLQYFLEFEYEILGREESDDWLSFLSWLENGDFISLGESSAYNLLFGKDF